VDSDVQLLPGQVKAVAWDLCLDAGSDRRKPAGTSPYRRALVHDFEDGLTLNWDGDYPGGVTINGNIVRVVGKLEITTETFQPSGAGTAGPRTTDQKATTRRPGGTVVAAVPHAAERTMVAVLLEKYLGNGPIDVVAALGKLVVAIDSAQRQLAQAQENWRWCSQCRCLFFAGNAANSNECSASKDGHHTLVGSGNYRLLHT
jgi:hypothetical protein